MAAGLCPGRALLSRRGGALWALLGIARGRAAGPETHFGFQNVSEAERREKSEGGGAGTGLQFTGGLGAGPGGEARCAAAALASFPLVSSPRSRRRVRGTAAFSPKGPLSLSKVNGILT